MRRKVAIAIAVIQLVIAFTGCSTLAKEKLNLELTQEVEYICSDESKINVRFYTLTDNSLYFVKVKMVDGKENHTRLFSLLGVIDILLYYIRKIIIT